MTRGAGTSSPSDEVTGCGIVDGESVVTGAIVLGFGTSSPSAGAVSRGGAGCSAT